MHPFFSLQANQSKADFATVKTSKTIKHLLTIVHGELLPLLTNVDLALCVILTGIVFFPVDDVFVQEFAGKGVSDWLKFPGKKKEKYLRVSNTSPSLIYQWYSSLGKANSN